MYRQIHVGKGSTLDELIAEFLAAKNIVAFTGAGISTECGIPDYRSPGGIWSKMTPIQFSDFMTSEEARLEDWRRRFLMYQQFGDAQPGSGHRALRALHDAGQLRSVVTQNIDGLHSKSGLPSEKVIELHGNGTFATCMSCGAHHDIEWAEAEIERTTSSPCCRLCSGHVKAAIISFGQMMPEEEMDRAVRDAQAADLMVVIGSSLVVHPAAQIPELAKDSGAQLLIINREPTPLDWMADGLFHGEISTFFERLLVECGSSTSG